MCPRPMSLLKSVFQPNSFIVADIAPSPNFDARKEQSHARYDFAALHRNAVGRRGVAASHHGAEQGIRALCRVRGRHNCTVRARRVARVARGQIVLAGETDINSSSIGIEIVNPGHEFGYPDFPLRQTAAVISLCRSIITRRGPISANRILAHSDVAPARKQDPGEKFPWGLLSKSGVGHWVRAAPLDLEGSGLRPGDRGDAVTRVAARVALLRLRVGGNRDFRRRDARSGDSIPAPFPAGTGRRHCRPFDAADVARTDRNAAGAARSARKRPVLDAFKAVVGAALTRRAPTTIPYPVSRPDGRPAPMPKGGRGGKSGLHGQTVPDNVRRDEPFWAGPGTVPQRTDRLGALRLAAARVKRCGKSAPRFRRASGTANPTGSKTE